ncbi:hypothetical protein PoB_002073700 [Plakobranchus ocellatus]|uniref:Uncharacterized protein n=1 Tax=Plakobranchus ocellatus TaxID=259542 RepID=A0AAV3ZFZ7_9GAST|nr:hypothetical protein PoB_002073700 [Plakobranchus ocellatus]
MCRSHCALPTYKISDSERYPGRLNSGGFRPYPKQMPRPQAFDCPSRGQQTNFRPQQDCPGIRPQRVSLLPRSNWWYADR